MSRRVLALAVALALLAGASVLVAAFGPAISKTCPAPTLRPSASGWNVNETRIGWFNGPGDIRGSSVGMTNGALRLELILEGSGPEGELGGDVVSVRGHEARRSVTAGGSDLGPGYDFTWHEGLFGCLDYELFVIGSNVTVDQATTIADSLR